MVSISKRLRLLVRGPWLIMRFWRALGAWERRDWSRMASLLQPVVTAGLHSTGESILLGVAVAGQGRFDEALWYFEQVDPKDLYRVEESFYANNYAYTLTRLGRLSEAQSLVRSFSRDRWPTAQRRWASKLLATGPPATPPPLGRLRLPDVFH